MGDTKPFTNYTNICKRFNQIISLCSGIEVEHFNGSDCSNCKKGYCIDHLPKINKDQKVFVDLTYSKSKAPSCQRLTAKFILTKCIDNTPKVFQTDILSANATVSFMRLKSYQGSELVDTVIVCLQSVNHIFVNFFAELFNMTNLKKNVGKSINECVLENSMSNENTFFCKYINNTVVEYTENSELYSMSLTDYVNEFGEFSNKPCKLLFKPIMLGNPTIKCTMASGEQEEFKCLKVHFKIDKIIFESTTEMEIVDVDGNIVKVKSGIKKSNKKSGSASVSRSIDGSSCEYSGAKDLVSKKKKKKKPVVSEESEDSESEEKQVTKKSPKKKVESSEEDEDEEEQKPKKKAPAKKASSKKKVIKEDTEDDDEDDDDLNMITADLFKKSTKKSSKKKVEVSSDEDLFDDELPKKNKKKSR